MTTMREEEVSEVCFGVGSGSEGLGGWEEERRRRCICGGIEGVVMV
jgi:hypothetical protein